MTPPEPRGGEGLRDIAERVIANGYTNTAEYALAQAYLSAPPVVGWRLASETPPDGLVLITGHDFGDEKNPRHYIVSEVVDGGFYDPETGDDHGYVTHWQPLPAAPLTTDGVG